MGSKRDRLPPFPRTAAVVALLALLIVAVGSLATNWTVGNRVRDITRSQLAVVTASAHLQSVRERKDSAMRMALETGNADFISEYEQQLPELYNQLSKLEQAIMLPENRAAFDKIRAEQPEMEATEGSVVELVQAGRLEEARSAYGAADARESRERFTRNLTAIEWRSRKHVETLRTEANDALDFGFLASIMAVALLGVAFWIIVKPARQWARELARAEAASAQAAEAKSRFLAVMSHEIRTPLNGVIGFADLLGMDQSLNDQQRRHVRHIQDAGGMLMSVVNDILDHSKIEAGKLDVESEPFSLPELIESSVVIARPKADAKALKLDWAVAPDCAVYYRGDAARLRQVLVNLIDNAVKFTESGGVWVRVSCAGGDAEDGHGELLFRVSDSGPGIDPDVQRKLFQPFSQADASIARKAGGTGLGLSICRGLVERMSGTIAVDSAPGAGATFHFRLQLPLAGQSAGATERADVAGRARILVVDDGPINRELAASLLARAGHDVLVAEGGREAIALAASREIDLVLMDIQMPDVDGMMATGFIRALPGDKGRVPILAMTANALPEQLASYSACGMNGHIVKPLRPDLLYAAIAKALGAEGMALRTEPSRADHEEEAAFDEAIFDRVAGLLGSAKFEGHIAGLEAEARALVTGEVEGETARAGAQDRVAGGSVGADPRSQPCPRDRIFGRGCLSGSDCGAGRRDGRFRRRVGPPAGPLRVSPIRLCTPA